MSAKSLIVAASLVVAMTSSAAGSPVTVRDGVRPGGWLPERCRSSNELAAASGEAKPAEAAEERWNRHYREGYGAIEAGELERAERALCLALDAARAFDARDPRFAETLDELGLVGYLRGDDALAEAMQGAATAEILLALGPPTRDQSQDERDRCSLSFRTFLARLGSVFARQGRAGLAAELERAPYRILERGYVPRAALAPRLAWLKSRYLLAEDVAAADWLTALEERLGADSSGP